MKHGRKFKTLVIHRNTLSVIIGSLVFGMFVGGLFFCTKTIFGAKQDDIYVSVLENGLPTSETEQNIAQKLIGFDIANPQTILLSGALFHALELQVADKTEEQLCLPEESGGDNETAESTSQPTKTEAESVHISKGMSVSNATSYDVDAQSYAAEPLDFKIDNNGAQVLIMHTHTTEAYNEDNDRSTDNSRNMVAVGDRICDVLNENGISAIHDTTVHDYPSYNGAYGRALTTIQNNIRANTGIKVVLDVHRDGLVKSDGTKLKVETEIDGTKAAQVMLVIGSDSMGLKHDNWRKNMVFASKIQKKANEMYPELMRPLNLREERFNQHLTTGSLIIEVGSNGNSLDEALVGGEAVAKVIAEVLKENM